MTTLKCPKCSSTGLFATERRPDGDSVCCECKYKAPTKDFQVLATASDRFKVPAGLDLNNLVKNQSEAIERLTRQLEAATVANQRLEAQVIGQKQQIADLKVGLSKLRAIKNELRNILWLKAKELEGR